VLGAGCWRCGWVGGEEGGIWPICVGDGEQAGSMLKHLRAQKWLSGGSSSSSSVRACDADLC
jgi:hypothetical protein